MWKNLLILPCVIVWAQQFGPNSIEPLPGSPCGNSLGCKPTSQCSVWFPELLAFPSKPCTDFRGSIGLCCPDVVQVRGMCDTFLKYLVLIIFKIVFPCSILSLATAIKFPATGELRIIPPIQPIPPAIIEQSSRSARIDLAHMTQVINCCKCEKD